MATNPLTPRPQVNSGSSPQRYQVTAQPVDLGANIRPAADRDLSGLVQGLQAFNPALARFQEVAQLEQQARDAEAERQRRKDAANIGKAQAERQDMGTLPLDLIPTPEAGLSGTAASIQREAFRSGVTARAALQVKESIKEKYAAERDAPGFDLEGFIATHRRENLAGLPADMAAQMGDSLTELEATIRQDYTRTKQARLDETREANIGGLLQDSVTLTDPQAMAGRYFGKVLPEILGQGKTRQEAAQYFLNHLSALSEQAGGRPEVFDAFMEKDPATGRSLFELNPRLQGQILAAKERAQAKAERALEEGAQPGNAQALKALDERVAANPGAVTFEDLLGNLGKHAVFRTDNEVISYWRKVLEARNARAGQENLLQLAATGKLYMADEKEQKDTMGALTSGALSALTGAIEQGTAPDMAAITDAIVSAHSKAGATAPSGPIQRMFSFIGKQGPVGDKPSPVFTAAAEMFRRLESHPQLREAYFDEDARSVMQAYVQAVQAQAEPAAAYKAAYEAVSPEAKRRAEVFKQSPEFREKLKKVSRWATGSSWWPQLLGGNGRPENTGQLRAEVQEFATEFLKRNPQASDEDVMQQAEAWAARSFALDTTTGTAVRVPPGVSAQATHEAISAYTQKLKADLRLKDREGDLSMGLINPDWGLTMIPINLNQGTYRIATAYNGAPVHMVAEVKIADILEQHRRDTHILPEDAQALREAKAAADAGRPFNSPAVGRALEKARRLRYDPDTVRLLDALSLKEATDALRTHLRSEDSPDPAALFKTSRSAPTDQQQTAASAARMLNAVTGVGGGSTALAASLITMGEGVALSAYDDPAQGAGKNIGTGYNLKANAATAPADLRAAGVPAERIQGVIDGALSISPEQSERLTLILTRRYEATAREQVTAYQPKLWETLSPQVRAVLTDIAYQTGDVGKFKKALTSLFTGDVKTFKDESRVFYTNRRGERVEDTRRGALRDAMLSGTSYWQQVIQRTTPPALVTKPSK